MDNFNFYDQSNLEKILANVKKEFEFYTPSIR